MSDELKKALGKSEPLTYDGKLWDVQALNMNDLADLEAEIGDVDNLNITTINGQRLVLWLALRKADPGLTVEQRKNREYKLSLFDVGDMVTAKQIRDPATMQFILSVLRMSELLHGSENEPKNAQAPGESPASGE